MNQRTLLALLLLSAACTDDNSKDPGDDSSRDAAADSGDGSLPADAGGRDAAVDASQDAGLDASDATVMGALDASNMSIDGSPDARLANDAQQDASGPTHSLASVQALQVGRFGDDLLLRLSGEANMRPAVAVRVELLTAEQAQIGPARVLPLRSILSGPTVTTTSTLLGALGDFPTLAQVRVSLLDDLGRQSSALTANVSPQRVAGRDQECDPMMIESRCADTDGCKGSPASCQAGVAPTITRAGYFNDAAGARIIFEGNDVDSNATAYTLRFYDASDALVEVDIDGVEETAPVSEWTAALDNSGTADFFQMLVPDGVLLEAVASIRIKVTDEADLSSSEWVAMRSPAPERALEQTCDPRGFNRCGSGAVCRELLDQHRCTLRDDARVASCEGALVLNPAAGVTRVRGALQSSLWEPPAGCAAGGGEQSDRVVKLVLAAPAARLLLSTDHPYTGMDTAVYLLATCTAAPELSRCAGGPPAGTNPKASLELTDVMAGTYYVVVDSTATMGATSSTFELTAEVQ